MENNLDLFFTMKHKRLSMIATAAAVFSWLVLILFVLTTISEFITFIRFQDMATLQENFEQLPETYINLFLEMSHSLLQGFTFFLVLRGVYLGLNMIIETELNYRDRLEGESYG